MPLIPLRDLLRSRPEIIQNRDVGAILTPEAWRDLESAYPSRFRELLLRDGQNPAFPDYTENIRENCLLQYAIHDMFRQFIILMVKDYIVASLPAMAERGRSRAIEQMHKEIETYCIRQLFKLTSPRYGYTVAQMSDIGLGAGPSLNHDAAVRVMGAAIKHSSEIFTQYFQCMGTIQKTSTMEIFEKIKAFRSARDVRSC